MLGLGVNKLEMGHEVAGHSGLKSNFLRPDLILRLRELLEKSGL